MPVNKINKKSIIFEQFYQIVIKKYNSNAQIANALGISRGTFWKYTRDNNPVSPKISTIEKWCKKLDIKIEKNNFFDKSDSLK